MLSQKLVFHTSNNFTSSNGILIITMTLAELSRAGSFCKCTSGTVMKGLNYIVYLLEQGLLLNPLSPSNCTYLPCPREFSLLEVSEIVMRGLKYSIYTLEHLLLVKLTSPSDCTVQKLPALKSAACPHNCSEGF
jgi:hypothetical protein